MKDKIEVVAFDADDTLLGKRGLFFRSLSISSVIY